MWKFRLNPLQHFFSFTERRLQSLNQHKENVLTIRTAQDVSGDLEQSVNKDAQAVFERWHIGYFLVGSPEWDKDQINRMTNHKIFMMICLVLHASCKLSYSQPNVWCPFWKLYWCSSDASLNEKPKHILGPLVCSLYVLLSLKPKWEHQASNARMVGSRSIVTKKFWEITKYSCLKMSYILLPSHITLQACAQCFLFSTIT